MSTIGMYLKSIRGFSSNARLWLLGMVLAGLGYAFTNVLFPLYLVKTGYQEAFIGSFSSVFSLAFGLTALPAGLLLRGRSRKQAIVVTSALCGVLGFLQVIWPLRPVLFTSNALFGALQTVIIICEAPFMMDNSTKEERSHLFSLNFAAMFAMFIVGNIVAGRMPALISAFLGQDAESITGFRYSLFVGMALRALSTAPLLFIQERAVSAKPRTDWHQILSMPSAQTIVRLCLSRALYALGFGLFQPFVQVLMKVKLGASTESIGIISSITNVGVTVGCLAAPYLERRFGLLRVISVTLLIAAPFLIVAGLSPVLWVVAFALVVRETLTMAAAPLRQRFSMEVVTQEERPILASLEQVAWQLPWAAGSFLGGYGISSFGYGPIFIAASLIFATSGLAYATLFSKEAASFEAKKRAETL